MCITIGSFYFKDAFTELQDGDVKGTTAQVIDGDRLILFLVQAIGQRSGRRLVDDTQYFQSGDLPGVLGCLALGIVKVGRYGYDCLRNLLAQFGFRVGLELLQDHRRDLGRTVFTTSKHHARITIGGACDFIRHTLHGALHFWVIKFATHQAFD